MNTFTKNLTAVNSNRTRTENGAATFDSSGSALTDLFFAIGASRGKDITNLFVRALSEDKDIAIRTMLWARDVRGGSGERQTVRNLLQYLESTDPEMVIRLIPKIAELGRFDDLFIFKTAPVKLAAFGFYREALMQGNGLAFKWAPREKSAKRDIAREFMKFLEMSPTRYRKFLASNTKVIEQNMCAKDWTGINYSHVPSVASARYRKAFYKNDADRYAAYVQALTKPETAVEKVKVNASAIFPYDVIKNLFDEYGYSYGRKSINETDRNLIRAQWKALPTVSLNNVLPVVDVSGSMMTPVSGSTQALHISVGLGLYLTERQEGAFKNVICSFSERPALYTVSGEIDQKIKHAMSMQWGMSTNLEAAFKLILDHAVKHNVPQHEMPKTLLILSDMEFNQCVQGGSKDTLYENARKQFNKAGYNLPQVVFWNLNARNRNNPVEFNTSGTALISGYSPNVAKALMEGDVPNPLAMLKKTVMKERYDY